jgi:AP-2 complex subunit alpha
VLAILRDHSARLPLVSSVSRCRHQVLTLLSQLAVSRICPADYVYHTTPCPWLQVALLRILQYFPLPEEYLIKNKLNDVLTTILTNTEVTKSVNKNNGEHAVLFEAVNIVIKQGEVCVVGVPVG